MALTDILQKITMEAEAEAAKALDEAKKKVAEIEKNGADMLTAAEEQVKEDTVHRKQSMERKVHAHVQMESKMGEVALKSELLESAQQAALEKIKNLPEKVQVEMMQALFDRISEDGTVHPAKGQKAIVEKAMKAAGKSFQMGEETAITAGFHFVGKQVDIDCSFEALLAKDIFPKAEAELSKTLFN